MRDVAARLVFSKNAVSLALLNSSSKSDAFFSHIRGAVLVGLIDQNTVPDALRPMLDEFPVIVTVKRALQRRHIDASALPVACIFSLYLLSSAYECSTTFRSETVHHRRRLVHSEHSRSHECTGRNAESCGSELAGRRHHDKALPSCVRGNLFSARRQRCHGSGWNRTSSGPWRCNSHSPWRMASNHRANRPAFPLLLCPALLARRYFFRINATVE